MAKQICERCGKNPVAFKGMTICGTCEHLEFWPTETQRSSLEEEIVKRADQVRCFTTAVPSGIKVLKEHGLVLGSSSKQAFWGLTTQSDRLTRAYDAALAALRYSAASSGANVIYGITIAVNNSTGSAASLLAGSSEAVILLGNAAEAIDEAD